MQCSIRWSHVSVMGVISRLITAGRRLREEDYDRQRRATREWHRSRAKSALSRPCEIAIVRFLVCSAMRHVAQTVRVPKVGARTARFGAVQYHIWARVRPLALGASRGGEGRAPIYTRPRRSERHSSRGQSERSCSSTA